MSTKKMDTKIDELSSKLGTLFDECNGVVDSNCLNTILLEFNLIVDTPDLTVYAVTLDLIDHHRASTRFPLRTFEIDNWQAHTRGTVFYLDADQLESLYEGIIDLACDVVAKLVNKMSNCHELILELLQDYENLGKECTCTDPVPYSYIDFSTDTPEIIRICRNKGCGGNFRA